MNDEDDERQDEAEEKPEVDMFVVGRWGQCVWDALQLKEDVFSQAKKALQLQI